MKAFVFPGQGSQQLGMLADVAAQYPLVRQVFGEASDALNLDLWQLCQENETDLNKTEYTQPVLLTAGVALWRVWQAFDGVQPQYLAGHSLGEYTAYLASGALSLSDAIRLVRRRGQLMQEAVPQGKGKMAALLGLADDKVRELCQKASQGEDSLVVAANFNAPSQVVIAGHTTAVDRAAVIAGTEGELKARKVIPLNVSAPFHSPLMKTVAEKFEQDLSSVKWHPQQFAIVNNLDARLRTEGDPVPILKDQINHPVLWTSCVETLKLSGHTKFVEMGPGKVLTGLVKRMTEGAQLFSIESIDDIQKFEGSLK